VTPLAPFCELETRLFACEAARASAAADAFVRASGIPLVVDDDRVWRFPAAFMSSVARTTAGW
jgi:hypothetical protein